MEHEHERMARERRAQIARELNAERAQTYPRDYYAEAHRIARGESLMVAERAHLTALIGMQQADREDHAAIINDNAAMAELMARALTVIENDEHADEHADLIGALRQAIDGRPAVLTGEDVAACCVLAYEEAHRAERALMTSAEAGAYRDGFRRGVLDVAARVGLELELANPGQWNQRAFVARVRGEK